MYINLSSTVVVADPVSSKEKMPGLLKLSGCVIDGIQPGRYNVIIKTPEDEKDRIGVLGVILDEQFLTEKTTWKHHRRVGIDTGTCGIFDIHAYYNDKNHTKSEREKWVDRMLHISDNKPYWKVVGNNGVVSSTGYGDGIYNVITLHYNKKIIGILVDYDILEVEEFLNNIFKKR